jgi:hypothetical protein
VGQEKNLKLTKRDNKMDTLAAQLMYLLQCGEVEVIIAIYIFLEGIKASETDNALIMGVDNELKFR